MAKSHVFIGDEMVWPSIGDPDDVERKLRHYPGELTAADRMHAASVMAAYAQLVLDPEAKRRVVIRALRAHERG